MYLSRLAIRKGLPSLQTPISNKFFKTPRFHNNNVVITLSTPFPIPTQKRSYSDKNHNHSSYEPNRPFKFGTFLIGLAVGAAFVYGTVSLAGLVINPKSKPSDPDQKKQRIVILGSGWGGLGAAKEIDTNRYEVVMVSSRDHFLFTPLLNDATFGDVDASSITESVRTLLQRWNPDVKFVDAVCTEINADTQSVKCSFEGSTFEIKYDKLLVAVGSKVDTYGIKGVTDNCMFLKEARDTACVRNKILDLFETANAPGKSEQQLKDLLHFVVVGTGAHSMQFVSSFKDLLDNELKTLYPHLINKVSVTFVDWRDAKNTYESKVNQYYFKNALKPISKQINIIKDNIKEVTKSHIVYENSKVPYGACVWITGNAPVPIVQALKNKKPQIQTNVNGLLTNQFLQVLGYNNIYAVGECATIAQSYLHDKWLDIFEALDEDKNGTIDANEFKALVPVFSREYPQLLEYAKMAEVLFEKYDINKDNKLSKEEFQQVLKAVDSAVTALPSTANVAVQQGRYIGNSLNMTLHESDLRKLFHELDEDKSGYLDTKELRKGLRKLGIPATRKEVKEMIEASDLNSDNKIDEEEFIQFALNHQQQGGTGDWKRLSLVKIIPFRYKHLGGYEYVGYENKITFRGSAGASILDGYGAWWLWNSVFASKLLGARIRLEITINYITRRLFGRNLTRY